MKYKNYKKIHSVIFLERQIFKPWLLLPSANFFLSCCEIKVSLRSCIDLLDLPSGYPI